MKSRKLIPTLRFSAFHENWTEKTIDDVFDRVVNPVKVAIDREYRQIGIRSHGKGIFHKEKVTGEELGNKRVFWLEEDLFIVNIVFAWEMAVAKTTSNEIGLIASHRFPMYKPKDQKLDLDFILYFFLRDKGKYIMELASPGGAGRNKTLGQKEFSKSKIIIPNNVIEQQKIASFLSSVDKKIQQLQQKQTLLEQYKKGVMQQIFSQELRFTKEDGSLYPDWEEKRLGEVLKIGSGKDYKHLKEGLIPVYGTGGLMTFVNDYLFEGESVGIGRKGTIDKPVFLKGKFWTVDTLFYSHSFNKVLPKFIYYFFLLVNWKKYNEASGVPSLSKGTIEKIKISVPCIEEQIQIAHFLSAIDKKIAVVQTQIEQTQIFKKGLLQQMFV